MIAILLFTLITRTVGEIAPPLAEGAAGRLLVLDRGADETIAIRTRVPYFDPLRAELAVSRIAADGTATTSTIAPIPSTAGIQGGDGAVTPNGYLVAWNDGGVHAAFIDSRFRLQSSTTLPSYGSYPRDSRDVVVRCTSRRCLVTWWELDAYRGPLAFGRVAASLFDTSGNVLAARIELTDGVRQPFTTPFGAAASSTRFMVAAWTTDPDYGPRQLRVISLDENGRAAFPVPLYETEDDEPTVVAIDSRGEEFVVVRALGGLFPAESVDAAGNVREPWHGIASSPDAAIDALHLRCSGDVSLLALESAHSHLNVIRLDGNLRAFFPPISVSDVWATNDSPKFLRTARGFIIGWNHGAAVDGDTYIRTTPRFAELPADGPAPASLDAGHPLFEGPAVSEPQKAVAMGDQYAVIRRVPTVRTTTPSVTVSLISREGITRASSLVSSKASGASMASDGTNALLAWYEDDFSVFKTRLLRHDGSLGPVSEYPRSRRGELIWDGREYATVSAAYVIETFDSEGSSLGTLRTIDGVPFAISGSGGRIAVACSTDGGTFLRVFDGRSGTLLGQTLLTTDSAASGVLITDERHVVAFVATRNKLSIFELDRNGEHLLSQPIEVPQDRDDFLRSAIPIGNRIAVVIDNGITPFLRMVDLVNRSVTGPMPIPDAEFTRADPGIDGSIVTLSSHLVRGEEMEGTSIIVREWLAPDTRRRSY